MEAIEGTSVIPAYDPLIDEIEINSVAGPVRRALPKKGRVVVVGAGKGSAPMAKGLEDLLGDHISGGLV